MNKEETLNHYEYKQRMEILKKHLGAAYYKTGELHNAIDDAMEEYASSRAENLVRQGDSRPVQKPEDETECREPCDPQVGCPHCADYWARMEHEGFWRNGKWTDKGMREILE